MRRNRPGVVSGGLRERDGGGGGYCGEGADERCGRPRGEELGCEVCAEADGGYEAGELQGAAGLEGAAEDAVFGE